MELRKNPFYILDIPCDAKRSQIVSAADDRSFVFDTTECSNAQNILLNPSKRIAAELRWFLDVDPETMKGIVSHIEKQERIPTEGLGQLSRLNAVIYNFSTNTSTDAYEVGFDIVEIDALFEALDIDGITSIINKQRRVAGFTELSSQDVVTELSVWRQEISNIIGMKFSHLNRDALIDLATVLAEKYMVSPYYRDGAVISDALDQYELSVQSEVEELTQRIKTHIDRIKRLTNDTAYESNIDALILRVTEWDHLVQPLQLKAKSTGLSHVISDDLASRIRGLALFLNNDKRKTELALKLVNSMKRVFAESPDYSAMFSDDYRLLKDMVEEEQRSTKILQLFKGLDRELQKLKTNANSFGVNNYLNRIKELDRLIRHSNSEQDNIIELRSTLCGIARNAAITLNNELQKPTEALTIIKSLLDEFGDLQEYRSRLLDDKTQLERNSFADNRYPANNSYRLNSSSNASQMYSGQRSSSAHSSYSHSGLPWYIRLAILAVIVIIVIWVCKDTSSSSSKGRTSTNNQATTTYTPPVTSANTQNSTTPSVVKQYKVTLNRNGGTGGTSTVNVTYGSPMPTATAPTRSGYDFDGYYDGSGTKYYNADMSSARNWDCEYGATLTAWWKEKTTTTPTTTTYTVTLDKNGGTGGTSTVYVTYGSPMPAATAPSKSGYTFEGYYDSSGNKYYGPNMNSVKNWNHKNGGKLTAKWKQIEEKAFTTSTALNTPVYVNIVSIFPEIGIYTEGTSYYKEFVCKCKTSSGTYVWVYMTCSDYKKYFDASASTSIYNSTAETKTFNTSKKIHGTTINADSVLSGLSSDTGKIIIKFKSVN